MPLKFWCLLPLVVCCALADIQVGAAADSSARARELQLWQDAIDGQLDEHTLLEAALAVGGEELPDRDSLLEPMACWRASIQFDCPDLKPSDAARHVHELLHAEVLHGKYVAEGYRVATAIAGGNYNCATSTVLYLELAAAAGLTACAVESTGHLCVRVDTPEGPLRVEPASHSWHSMADTFAHASAGRPLTSVQLIAALYHNRGVMLLENRDYAGAAEAAQIALLFDVRCDEARNNLLATYNNWAVSLARTGHFDAADAILAEGFGVAPNYGPLLVNRRYIDGLRAAAKP